jgi:hypothetical protein
MTGGSKDLWRSWWNRWRSYSLPGFGKWFMFIESSVARCLPWVIAFRGYSIRNLNELRPLPSWHAIGICLPSAPWICRNSGHRSGSFLQLSSNASADAYFRTLLFTVTQFSQLSSQLGHVAVCSKSRSESSTMLANKYRSVSATAPLMGDVIILKREIAGIAAQRAPKVMLWMRPLPTRSLVWERRQGTADMRSHKQRWIRKSQPRLHLCYLRDNVPAVQPQLHPPGGGQEPAEITCVRFTLLYYFNQVFVGCHGSPKVFIFLSGPSRSWRRWCQQKFCLSFPEQSRNNGISFAWFKVAYAAQC